MQKTRHIGRLKRKKRIRNRISGTHDRPRLAIFRSLKHLYAQIIDDESGRTLVSASTLDQSKGRCARNKATAVALGQQLAEKAKAIQVDKVVFDRNGYLYHGVVKAFADSARESGLNF